jgi:hypothetical protein
LPPAVYLAASYQDQHSSLKRNDAHWSLEEQLASQQAPTQVGTVFAELGIQPLFAFSDTPQWWLTTTASGCSH